MSYSMTQLFKVNSVIDKVVARTRQQCEEFALEFQTHTDPMNFQDTIDILYEALNDLSNTTKENFDHKMLAAVNKLKNMGSKDQNKGQIVDMVVMKKKSENEHDLQIENQWREAKSHFFTHQIRQKLSSAKIVEWQQEQIIKLFIYAYSDSQSQLIIQWDQLGHLSEYKQEIMDIYSSFELINQSFQRKKSQCLPIAHIIRCKFTQLKLIHIQYDSFYYSVSAFELFKVVHENRQLNEVTLKGLDVKNFQQFMKALAQSKKNEKTEELSEDRSWMKSFNPSKSLKLAIDTLLCFWLQKREETHAHINNLVQFIELFESLSNVSVLIRLGNHTQLINRTTLEHLFKNIKRIKKIKLQIQGDCSNQVDQSYAVVFQLLASLTEITHLLFSDLTFVQNVGDNDYLAMEKSIANIFKNNTIISLAFQSCLYFPVFPAINTLQKVSCDRVWFYKQVDFVSSLVTSNLSLKTLACCLMSEEWRIEEQLFDRLQALNIRDCTHIALGSSFSAQSPSNIKHLTIHRSNIGNLCPVLFPKLASLTRIDVGDIDFGTQLLCAIPSPHLEQLGLSRNNKITSQGLQAIDKKWPQLRWLKICQCPNINDEGWSACQFKGLIRLITKYGVLQKDRLKQLRCRGIKVTYN